VAAVLLLPLYATVTDSPKLYGGVSQSSQQLRNGLTATPLTQSAHGQGTVDVSSDVLKLTFENAGGSLVRAELLKYADNADDAKPMVLFDNSESRIFVGQSGLIGGETAGTFPTHKTPMRRIGTFPLVTVAGQQVITFASDEVGGLVLTKTYVLEPGSYSIAVRHEIRNVSAVPISPLLYMQLVRDGNGRKLGPSERLVFIGPAVYTGSKGYQHQEFSDIKGKKSDYQKYSSDGYIAMVEHHYASAWLVSDGTQRTYSVDGVDIGSHTSDCCYRATMIISLGEIPGGSTKAFLSTLYVGPQERRTLKAVDPRLIEVIDYGWHSTWIRAFYALTEH
jgi:YidC/Oxa1 family membrane protein insertase